MHSPPSPHPSRPAIIPQRHHFFNRRQGHYLLQIRKLRRLVWHGHGFDEVLLELWLHGGFDFFDASYDGFDFVSCGFVQQCNARTRSCGVAC